MFCPEEGEMVPPEEIIRGYETGPDKYVLMTDEELESLSPERSRTIEIIEFIDLREVDPIYYDHPYYLVPSKGGEKAYRLLVEVMHRTNKAGLAKLVLAEREHLVAVFSRDGALALTTLHYRDEIRPEEASWPGEGMSETGEEDRIRKTIEQMTRDFDPGKYANARLKRIRDLLAVKAKQQGLVEAPAAAEQEEAGPPDLVAALEESMRKVKESR
jgi:DNA end-binding protein Ku